MVTHMPAMTPQVHSPSLKQQATPPWCIHTPEPFWLGGSAPHCGSFMLPQTASAPNGMSKDFLRQVCEPFFEQMLLAVHLAVQMQDQCHRVQVVPEWVQQKCQLEPSTEDESDISMGDFGANSTVFSSPSCYKIGEEEEVAKTRAPAFMPTNIEPRCSQEVQSELPHGNDDWKVCKHWKAKGWCRMGDKCKFLHKESTFHVGVAHGCELGHPNSVFGHSSERSENDDKSKIHSYELALSAIGGKKKTGKRKNKAITARLCRFMGSEPIPAQVFDLPLLGLPSDIASKQDVPALGKTMWP